MFKAARTIKAFSEFTIDKSVLPVPPDSQTCFARFARTLSLLPMCTLSVLQRNSTDLSSSYTCKMRNANEPLRIIEQLLHIVTGPAYIATALCAELPISFCTSLWFRALTSSNAFWSNLFSFSLYASSSGPHMMLICGC